MYHSAVSSMSVKDRAGNGEEKRRYGTSSLATPLSFSFSFVLLPSLPFSSSFSVRSISCLEFSFPNPAVSGGVLEFLQRVRVESSRHAVSGVHFELKIMLSVVALLQKFSDNRVGLCICTRIGETPVWYFSEWKWLVV